MKYRIYVNTPLALVMSKVFELEDEKSFDDRAVQLLGSIKRENPLVIATHRGYEFIPKETLQNSVIRIEKERDQ